MIIRDYEQLAPTNRIARPHDLESQLARAQQADALTESHGNRFASVRTVFIGLYQAVAGWVKTIQSTRVAESEAI